MNKYLRIILLMLLVLTLQNCGKKQEAIQPAFPAVAGQGKILKVTQLVNDSVNCTSYLEIYNGLQPITAAAALDQQYWQACKDTFYSAEFGSQKDRWFRFTINNDSSINFDRLLCLDNFEYATMYYHDAKAEKTGTMAPVRDWSYPDNNTCLSLIVNKSQTKTFFLHCDKGMGSLHDKFFFIIRTQQNENSRQGTEMKARMEDTNFLFFFLGFLFFCFIYFLAQFINRGEKMLAVYAFYILFTFFYSFRDLDKHPFLTTTYPLLNGINVWYEAIFSYLSYMLYVYFLSHYLLEFQKEIGQGEQVKDYKKRKRIYRFTMVIISIIGFLLLCDLVLHLAGQHAAALHLFLKARVFLFPFTILFLILVIPYFKDPRHRYFLYGSIFLVLGTGCNLLVHPLRNVDRFHDTLTGYGFWGNPVNYTRLGVMLEVLFFSLGLANRTKLDFAKEVLKQDNVANTEFYAHEIQSGLIILQDKYGTDSQAGQYMKKYRKYLSKLLRLLRDKIEVELTDEIEMVKAHFSLKQEDNGRFEFNFENTTGLADSDILFPTGLLTPFVQNFFKHGINPIMNTYKFNILVYLDHKQINLDVTDNGKGLEPDLKEVKPGGVGLTNARHKVDIYNAFTGAKVDFDFHPAETGVLVKITNLKKKKNV